MSRGLRWTPESLTARGWKDSAKHKTAEAMTDRGKAILAGTAPKIPLRITTGMKPADAPTAAQEPARARKRPVKAIPYEREVLRAVLAALKAHPRVAWVVRLNSGMAMLPGRGGKPQPVRFGFPGCPDIIGQTKWNAEPCMNWHPGAFLAVEVKRPGKKATAEQAAFLQRVRESGGVGFVATGVEDVFKHLGGGR